MRSVGARDGGASLVDFRELASIPLTKVFRQAGINPGELNKNVDEYCG